MDRKLILIIPVLNGENFLPDTFKKLDDFFYTKKYLDKIIFVNDGSNDKTPKLLAGYQRASALNIEIMENVKNSGKGGAIKKAVSAICPYADIIAFTDVDLPYGLSSVEAMVKIFSADLKAGLIIGNRNLAREKQYSPYRYFLKRIFIIFLPRKLKKYTDTQSGIKSFNGEIANNFKMIKSSGWCFDLELLLIAINNNCKIIEIPVQLEKVHFFGGVSLIKHGLVIMRDLIYIKIREKRGLYNYKNG